jgi:hypothetical protein
MQKHNTQTVMENFNADIKIKKINISLEQFMKTLRGAEV